MLKLPFFNRIKPIVVNFYTVSTTVAELAPPVLSSRVEHPFKHEHIDEAALPQRSFRGCYGYLKGLKTSITVPSWCDFSVSVKGGNPRYNFPMDNPLSLAVEIASGIDPNYENDWVSYHKDPDFYDNVWVSKLKSPWIAVCEDKPRWVLGQHLLNTSGMCIPTGILDLKYQYEINMFNYLPKYDCSYNVKAGTPLLSLYPIMEPDRPIKVNAIYDPEKFITYCNSSNLGRLYKNAVLYKTMRESEKREQALIKK